MRYTLSIAFVALALASAAHGARAQDSTPSADTPRWTVDRWHPLPDVLHNPDHEHGADN